MPRGASENLRLCCSAAEMSNGSLEMKSVRRIPYLFAPFHVPSWRSASLCAGAAKSCFVYVTDRPLRLVVLDRQKLGRRSMRRGNAFVPPPPRSETERGEGASRCSLAAVHFKNATRSVAVAKHGGGTRRAAREFSPLTRGGMKCAAGTRINAAKEAHQIKQAVTVSRIA